MNDASLDAAWALNVLEDALRRMRGECQAAQHGEIWDIYQARTLMPLLRRTAPISYESLVQQYGLTTPRRVANLLRTGRRMFARILANVVGEYVSEDEIENEIAELRTVLASGEGAQKTEGRVFFKNVVLHENDAQRLSVLFTLDVSPRDLWQADEPGPILRHQLAAPIELDLYLGSGDTTDENLSHLAFRYGNLGALLASPQPPLPLLIRLKDYSRQIFGASDAPLPEQLSMALYWAAIAAALVRCGTCISGLGTEGMQRGLQWAVDQPWFPEDLRRLFGEAQSLVP